MDELILKSEIAKSVNSTSFVHDLIELTSTLNHESQIISTVNEGIEITSKI